MQYMAFRLITLTTDFGLKDPYVAEMKAVILSICPEAVIVDISHEVEKFDIRMGAYFLASAAPYFPKGTIHVAVVDPGVGTKRQPLLIQARHNFFIGPDNGILAMAARKQGILHTYKIVNHKLMLPRVSNTFHGRDIFAPVAAHVANGTPPTEFGPEIRDIVMPGFVKPRKEKNRLVGEVLHVDRFGNIVTNVDEKELELTKTETVVNIKLRNAKLRLKLCKAYGEVEKSEALAIIGSHDFLEIAINQGNAAESFGARIGDEVILRRS
jgi:hypothetical protein